MKVDLQVEEMSLTLFIGNPIEASASEGPRVRYLALMTGYSWLG